MVTVTEGEARSCPLHAKSLVRPGWRALRIPMGFCGRLLHTRGINPPQPRLGPLRDLIDDRLLDAPLEQSRDQAGKGVRGLRLIGQGSMLGKLVKAVLERGAGGGADRVPGLCPLRSVRP
jgi:hypothetical protein